MNIAHSENQSIPAATQPQPSPVTQPRPERPLCPCEPQLQNGPSSLQPFLDAKPPSQMALQTSVTGPPVSTVQTCLVQDADQARVRSPHSGVRNGKIARLPTLPRNWLPGGKKIGRWWPCSARSIPKSSHYTRIAIKQSKQPPSEILANASSTRTNKTWMSCVVSSAEQ